jgi:3-oxoadipate enol-lactonase
VEKVAHMLVRTVSTGYTASCGALRDADLRDKLGDIKAPTLVITGTHDAATPPEDGKFLAAGIAGAKYLELDAAHISNWEQPAQYTAAVLEFLG